MPIGLPSLSEVDDWYAPQQHLMPVAPQGLPGPGQPSPRWQIPDGSHFSPSRNMWRAPTGETFDARDYRPLAPNDNTLLQTPAPRPAGSSFAPLLAPNERLQFNSAAPSPYGAAQLNPATPATRLQFATPSAEANDEEPAG